MTLPSPDDREAVARWLITLRCADDAPQIVLPVDLRVAEEIHRLIRAAVEREREECAQLCDNGSVSEFAFYMGNNPASRALTRAAKAIRVRRSPS